TSDAVPKHHICEKNVDLERIERLAAIHSAFAHGQPTQAGSSKVERSNNNREDYNGNKTHRTTNDRRRARHVVPALSSFTRSGLAFVLAARLLQRHSIHLHGGHGSRTAESDAGIGGDE